MANRIALLSVGLVVVGVLLSGYGVAGSLGPSECGTYVAVDQTGGQSDHPRTRFNDLTDREKGLFEKALDSNGMARVSTDDGGLPSFSDQTTVVYRGENYSTGLVSNDGCVSPLSGINTIPIAGGSLLLIVGVYGTVRERRN